MPLNLNGKPDHPTAELIEDARMQASTEWEEEFCADIASRAELYGDRLVLTSAQRAKLHAIAHGEDDDLTTRSPRFGRR